MNQHLLGANLQWINVLSGWSQKLSFATYNSLWLHPYINLYCLLLFNDMYYWYNTYHIILFTRVKQNPKSRLTNVVSNSILVAALTLSLWTFIFSTLSKKHNFNLCLLYNTIFSHWLKRVENFKILIALQASFEDKFCTDFLRFFLGEGWKKCFYFSSYRLKWISLILLFWFLGEAHGCTCSIKGCSTQARQKGL